MTPRQTAIELGAFWLLVASLGAVQFNLLTAQTLFGLSAILWVAVAVQDRKAPAVPAFFLPLAAYILLTLASALLSLDVAKSLIDCKQLVLFLLVPMVMRLARGDRAMTAINAIIALGAAGAMVGVIEYAMLGNYDAAYLLEHRPTGALSHYMTYSGVLMLVTCAAAGRLLFYPQQRIWPAIAVPALLAALVFTQARNAWIGLAAAVAALLAVIRPRLVLIVPVLIAVGLLIAPASIRNRAYSIVDLNDPSNKDRLQMLVIGKKIVSDHPFFGVGPEMIETVYPQYRAPDAVHPTNPHLHNVPMQIAAERGLLALAAWLWFVVVAARDLFGQLKRGPHRAVAAAGAAAVVAMLFAGLFEYNFGDSEFLMLFLGLITLASAAKAAPRLAPVPHA